MKPAASAAPAPKAPAPNACVVAVSEMQSELRRALDGDVPDPTAEQRAARTAAEAELAKARASEEALEAAVEKGVPRAALAEAMDASAKRIATLTEQLAAQKPSRTRGLATMHERLDLLAISVESIQSKLAEFPALAPSQPGTPEPDRVTPPAAPAAPPMVGLNIDAGLAGLYAFRGLNVFKGSSQMDQHALFGPGLTYNPTWAEGLSVGYWGAYQLTGDNASQLVKQGIGNEQDLTVSYGRDVVKEKLQGRVGVTNYVYPFAERAVAGTTNPYFFEPWAQATYTGPVTASLLATYFYGTQDAVRLGSYFYARPAVEKTFTVNKSIGFTPGVGGGYKVFTHNGAITDNRYEITGDMKLPIAYGDNAYMTPGLHYAWTNFSNNTVASAHAVWLSVNVGLNL